MSARRIVPAAGLAPAAAGAVGLAGLILPDADFLTGVEQAGNDTALTDRPGNDAADALPPAMPALVKLTCLAVYKAANMSAHFPIPCIVDDVLPIPALKAEIFRSLSGGGAIGAAVDVAYFSVPVGLELAKLFGVGDVFADDFGRFHVVTSWPVACRGVDFSRRVW